MGAHILRLAAENDNVHAHVSYSRPRPQDVEGRDYDSRGRVSVELLKNVLPPAAYDFYLCGPTPFMKSLYNGLLTWGVAETRIHYEFFGPVSALKEGAEATRKPATASGRTAGLEVSFAKTGLTRQVGSVNGEHLRPRRSARPASRFQLPNGYLPYVHEQSS